MNIIFYKGLKWRLLIFVYKNLAVQSPETIANLSNVTSMWQYYYH